MRGPDPYSADSSPPPTYLRAVGSPVQVRGAPGMPPAESNNSSLGPSSLPPASHQSAPLPPLTPTAARSGGQSRPVLHTSRVLGIIGRESTARGPRLRSLCSTLRKLLTTFPSDHYHWQLLCIGRMFSDHVLRTSQEVT